VIRKYTNLLSLLVAFASVLSFAQTQPCPSGTLANVIGTSCTIGNVTFTFDNNFQGFHQTNDTGTNLVTTFFTPDTIGFVPLQSANRVGFQLNPNFVADATSMFLNFFDANFSYGLAVNGNFEIVDETGSIAASITRTANENVSSFDAHCFTNQRCIEVAPTLNFIPGGGATNTLSQSATLAIPGLVSNNPNPLGLHFTTNLTAFAFNPGDAVLSSATFLYTVAPQVPLPPLAKLDYTNIDIPNSLATQVEGLNDHGQTVGVFRDSTGVVRGYMADEDAFQIITFPNAVATQPFGINNQGDIVGSYRDTSRLRHGFLLHQDVFTTVDFPGSTLTIATSINEDGKIAGFYSLPNFSTHGFVFDENGFTTVDEPDQRTPALTEVFGINDRGNLSGLFFDPQFAEHGFLFSNDDGFEQINVPGGFQVFGEGLSDSGSVVGGFQDLHAFSHGFMAHRERVRTVDFPGSTGTFPVGINSRGQIAGQYFDQARGLHSFLAERHDHDDDDADGGSPDDTSDKPAQAQQCSEQDRLQNAANLKNPQSCDPDN